MLVPSNLDATHGNILSTTPYSGVVQPNDLETMGNILTWVAVILIVLWLIGYVGFGEAVGNFIHILLVLAVIAILIRLFSGRRVV